VKRSKLGTLQYLLQSFGGGFYRGALYFETDDKLYFSLGNTSSNIYTTAVFRDVSAWYHVVVKIDTTQATQAAGMKLYVNGVEQVVTNVGTYTQNDEGWINSTNAHQISGTSSFYFDGYLADIYLLDGTATTPSTFAETDAITGQWMPKTPTGISYGTNGFRLTFSDNSGTSATTLGKDSAGSNNWTPNNFSVASGSGNDSLVDVPTNGAQTDTGAGGEVRGNYCTWNAVAGSGALANGNLDFSSSGNPHKRIGTIGVASGKWYFEAVCTTQASSFQGIGVGKGTFISDSGGVGGVSSSWGVLCETGVGNGYLYHNSSNAAGDIGTINVNDVMMFALDVDAGKFWVGLNGTWYNSGSPSGGTNATWTGVTGELFPVISSGSGGAMFANFGQRPFAYTAPSGFKALNTANLPAPLVTKPNTVMDVKLYTGTGATQNITGLAFSPDLVWAKVRNTTGNHSLYDIVRGATKRLASSTTSAEATFTNSLTSFDSGGFSLGSNPDGDVNASGNTYAAWTWDAGSSTDTNNTAGTITPTGVRANATAGFSIVTYTGTGANATVGHGLGVAPQMIIVKTRSAGNSWKIYHSGLTSAAYNLEFTTGAQLNEPQSWNSTAPTSTVFSVGTQNSTNQSGATQVAYCFAPVVGYSSFGSYTGNGSTDGPCIYTGFRPRWVLIKASSTTGEWGICDSARDTYNVVSNVLLAESSGSDNPGLTLMDFTSNGFKLRNTNAVRNGSGQTYIYAAFAESPFNYARAR
jgi:hypothetical protein